jgi:predicted O-methyltransferase YrrM
MSDIIEEIFASSYVTDAAGKRYKLVDCVARGEGEYLFNLVKNNRLRSAIEIGCAYGVSSLYICEALKNNSGHCVIIDPSQSRDWHNIGINNLRKAGCDCFDCIEQPSELALPDLLREGRKFDFAFIDGWHTMDHVLLDFFYIDRMLDIGGLIVLHDSNLKGIEKAARYISGYPNYEIVSHYGDLTLKTKMLNMLYRFMSFFVVIIPRRIACHIFDFRLIEYKRFSKILGNMVVFRKTGPDTREWYWSTNF